MALNSKIKSEPLVVLNKEMHPRRVETGFTGSFGSISNVVVKLINKSSSDLAVRCEAKVLDVINFHPLFPTIYGIHGTHNLVMEDLGWFNENGDYQVTTIHNAMVKLSKKSCIY